MNEQLKLHDHVSYKRTNGSTVRGFVDRLSMGGAVAYIFNTSTGDIVAAPSNRVEIVK